MKWALRFLSHPGSVAAESATVLSQCSQWWKEEDSRSKVFYKLWSIQLHSHHVSFAVLSQTTGLLFVCHHTRSGGGSDNLQDCVNNWWCVSAQCGCVPFDLTVNNPQQSATPRPNWYQIQWWTVKLYRSCILRFTKTENTNFKYWFGFFNCLAMFLPSLQELHISCCLRKDRNILKDSSHPGHIVFQPLSSGRM